jgi:hypothetical protein
MTKAGWTRTIGRLIPRLWAVGVGAALCLLASAGQSAASTTGTCSESGTTMVTVTCTVGSGSWTPPAHVTFAAFDLLAGSGGSAPSLTGGEGGQTTASDVQVSPLATYQIVAGASGSAGDSGVTGSGGALGGASGSCVFVGDGCGSSGGGGGGGGASVVAIGSTADTSTWLLAAGGGGGAGRNASADGGAGGGATAGDGAGTGGGAGGGQTLTSGSGQHVSGSGGALDNQGGGGGGGFVGGAGGSSGDGGGGGSGFVASGISGATTNGGNVGDGAVTITYTVPGPPTAAITTPADGANYVQGQSVDADYGCTEAPGGPGLTSCTGDVANGNPIDTSTAGSHSFTVIAASSDGLTSTQTSHYAVSAASSPSNSAPNGEDARCERLRKKLKRQKRHHSMAATAKKRSFVEHNIAQTRLRLSVLGCVGA